MKGIYEQLTQKLILRMSVIIDDVYKRYYRKEIMQYWNRFQCGFKNDKLPEWHGKAQTAPKTPLVFVLCPQHWGQNQEFIKSFCYSSIFYLPLTHLWIFFPVLCHVLLKSFLHTLRTMIYIFLLYLSPLLLLFYFKYITQSINLLDRRPTSYKGDERLHV